MNSSGTGIAVVRHIGRSALVLFALVALCLVGCGGGGGGPAPTRVTVAINPNTVSVILGGSQTFTATVAGSSNTGVTWSVQEGAAGGTVSSTGVYTAPATAGTYHVVATSVAAPSSSASSEVIVSAIGVAINPSTASMPPGGSQAFAATVTGSSNTGVTWSVQEGSTGGSITSAGVYTAPSATGTYHVVATSSAAPSSFAVATVTVSSTAVTIAPTSVDIAPAGSQVFAATVTGTSNTGVFWTVKEGSAGGSVNNSGVYTAPNASGTYHVVATSVSSPTASATATVNVHLLISVAPSSLVTTLGQTQTFKAKVVGSTNASVSWGIQEGGAGGTISKNGVYVAPNVPGTYHVIATSLADTNQSAIVTITVQAGSATGTIQ